MQAIKSTKKQAVMQILRKRVLETFGSEHISAMDEIILRESGGNWLAQNRTSTAFGMFQFLDSTWKGYGCTKTINPLEQIECGIKYVKGRYGTPVNALAFWERNHYY